MRSLFRRTPMLEDYASLTAKRDDSIRGVTSAAGTKGDGPLVSVVTVVFNGAALLERTILSVMGQSHPNVEYIVIDGGSSDGSLDIIKRYGHAIDFFVSAKDEGIADAMNKGIASARGEIVNFLNAGDYYVDGEALAYVAKWYSESPWWWAYGLARLQIGYRETSLRQRARPFRKWKNYYLTQNCHQATFFRRTLFERIGLYSIGYDRLFDVEFYIRASALERPATSSRLIVWYDVTGLSSQVHWPALRSRILLTLSYCGPVMGLPWIVPIVVRWIRSGLGLGVKRLFRAYRPEST